MTPDEEMVTLRRERDRYRDEALDLHRQLQRVRMALGEAPLCLACREPVFLSSAYEMPGQRYLHPACGGKVG